MNENLYSDLNTKAFQERSRNRRNNIQWRQNLSDPFDLKYSSVFKRRRKIVSDGDDVTSRGRLFNTHNIT